MISIPVFQTDIYPHHYLKDFFFLFVINRVVKEEISDDNAKLPCVGGRVVSWVCRI